MVIGIDFRLANRSHRGMARYCREIVKELLILDPYNNYVLYIDAEPKLIMTGTNYRYAKIGTTNFILGEQLYLPMHVKNDSCDIFWSPYNSFPIFLPSKTKLLVSIHDVIFLYKLPPRQSLYQKIGALYRRFLLKFFWRKIDGCFTVSKFSRTEILRYIPLSVPIEITYNCISGFAEKVRQYRKNNPDLMSKDYFFTISGDAPSKNLTTLISVFESALKNQTLIIGGISKNSPLRRYSSDRIKFLDDGVSDSILIKTYLECKCFLFCSKYEGFGIPVIEAAICEKPIIASNATSLPEILNGCGLLIEPSYKGILSGINFYLKNPATLNVDYKKITSLFYDWKNPANVILRHVSESKKN